MDVKELERKHGDLMDAIDVILLSLDKAVSKVARDINDASLFEENKSELKDVLKRFRKVTKDMTELYNNVENIERNL